MQKKHKIIVGLLLGIWLIGILALLVQGNNVAVLNTHGIVGNKERSLIIFASLLSLIVVLPVFVMTALIVWRYREGNTKAKYSPEFANSRWLETIWWGVPLVLIIILSVVTYRSSHELDPFKPLISDKQALTIQVVALDWKWLFIYPEQNIASLNYVRMPVDRPVHFEITSNGPMNSFWIPQLGGQVYAMSGMKTELNLMANQSGSYRGSSANISGKGFAGMNFVAEATNENEFAVWADSVRSAPRVLDAATYTELAKPSESDKPAYYALGDPNLYNMVVMQYMEPRKERP